MTETINPWVIAHFEPTAFFSLKPASATSSGGKSLVLPTPFAIKMALLDVALRILGREEGAAHFEAIRDVRIAAGLPKKIVVNNTFIKIMRPNDSIGKAKKDEKEAKLTEALVKKEWPMRNTIAFREYITYYGEMHLAFQGMLAEILTPLLLQINYFGKRGGFMQLQDIPKEQTWSDERLNKNGYTLLTKRPDDKLTKAFHLDGLLQMLDDCGPKMTFEQVNIYNSGKGSTIRLGSGEKDRQLHHVVLPYRLVRSSKGYSYYERIEG